jgi:UDP-N-acetyl-D-mannosaminuronic acid transferase (WecB/TagA/CpsF family)
LNRIDLASEISRFTVSWHALAVLTAARRDSELPQIFAKAQLIIAGAYDGESFVYWARGRPNASTV